MMMTLQDAFKGDKEEQAKFRGWLKYNTRSNAQLDRNLKIFYSFYRVKQFRNIEQLAVTHRLTKNRIRQIVRKMVELCYAYMENRND